MPHRIARQIHTALAGAKRVLLIPHKNPDGDALGSVTALMHLLRRMGTDHAVFCITEYTNKLSYLPGVDELTTDQSLWHDDHFDFDVVLVVDTGDLSHAGISDKIQERNPKPFIINIDHHATNTMYGDLNLVLPKASSTCEILATFFKINNEEIDSHIATCLLTGLITDTGNFTNAATTVQSLKLASELIRKGGDLKKIQRTMLKDKTMDSLKLWGAVLSRIAKHDTHEIVHTFVTQQDMKEMAATDDDVDGLANFMQTLSEGKAIMVLRELPDGKVKGSFRTTRNDTDVAAMAKKLGGGGHTKAAGFTVDGPIETAYSHIWSTLE